MTQSSFSEPFDTVVLQQDGRMFPMLPSIGQQTAELIRQLPSTPADHQLSHRLYEHLLPVLPWSKQPVATNRREANHLYSSTLNAIRSFQNDVNRLLEVNCDANLQYIAYHSRRWNEPYPEANSETYRHERAKLVAQSLISWTPPTPVSDAQMMSRELPDILLAMEASVKTELRRFVVQFEEGLLGLVHKEVCGLVEWLPNSCCRYHFFRMAIEQQEGQLLSQMSEESDSVSASVTGDVSFEEDEDFDDELEPGWDNDGEDTDSEPQYLYNQTFEVPYDVRQIRYEHELINTVRTSIGNTRVIMPENVRKVVATTPEWLYPFVDVVDGTLVRRRVVQQVIRSSSTKHFVPVVEVEAAHSPDPGLLIGSVIISGWGPEEIQAEVEKQQSEDAVLATRKSEDQRSYYMMTATFLTGLFAVLLLVLIYRFHIGRTEPLLLAATSFTTAVSLWQSIFLWTRELDPNGPPWTPYTKSFAGFFGLFAGLSLLFHVPGTSFLLTKLLTTVTAGIWLFGQLTQTDWWNSLTHRK